jgi:EpsI family protein
VLYWYQARDRTVASEYKAALYSALDAIRYRRSDTALVRVVVPVREAGVDAATEVATSFVKDFYAPIRHYLPA